MFGFLFKRQKKKHDATRFPPNWPSYLHNKCNVPICDFANPPQAASGTYNCQGTFGGRHCNGTYYVSSSMADSMMKNYSFRVKRESDINGKSQVIFGQVKQMVTNLPLNVNQPRPANSSLHKYATDKKLPGIPGLDKREMPRHRSRRHQAQVVAAPPSRPLHRPLYPDVVEQYYPQSAHPTSHHDRSRHPGFSSTAPLVPQRRHPSTRQALAPSQHPAPFLQSRFR